MEAESESGVPGVKVIPFPVPGSGQETLEGCGAGVGWGPSCGARQRLHACAGCDVTGKESERQNSERNWPWKARGGSEATRPDERATGTWDGAESWV